MLELLKKRRSIRRYKADPVEPGKIEELVKALLLSPSSRNIRPWEFIVVTDNQLLEQLSRSKEHHAAFLKGAPLGIVVLADETKSDVWVEDSSIASIIVQLAAESMGLGSCWIQIRNRMHDSNQTAEDYIKNLLHIPANYKVESIIALGYPDETRPPHDENKLQYEKVFTDRYGEGYK